MERIAIFVALRWEARPVLRALQRVRRRAARGFTVWTGRAGDREVWVVKTGMGMERAAAAAREVRSMAEFASFVSSGCAGALSSDLAPGDLVAGTAVCDSSGATRGNVDAARVAEICSAVEKAGRRVARGTLMCSGAMLGTSAEKRRAASCGAIAVDMEGLAIAAEAAAAGISFAAVRAILDRADTELPGGGLFVDPITGAVKPLGLARYLAVHPGAVSELLSMQRMMRAAEESLSVLFAAWLK